MNEPREITWREPELEKALRHYLAEHPEAMDTAEGIAEWWLVRQRIRIDLEALEMTLHRLTNEGVLEQLGSGTHTLYRLRIKS